MKRILSTIMTLLIIVGCNNNNESHIVLPKDKGAVVIEFDVTGLNGAPPRDLHLYYFNNADTTLVTQAYYETLPELANNVLPLDPGVYTILAVLNAGKDPIINATGNTISNPSLNDVHSLCLLAEKKFPDIITGVAKDQEVAQGAFSTAPITLVKGVPESSWTTVDTLSDGEDMHSLSQLTVTLPDEAFGKHSATSTKSAEPLNMRVVVGFYNATLPGGKKNQAAIILKATSNARVYTADFMQFRGYAGMLVWVDYAKKGSTNDLYYDTNSLMATHILRHNYQEATNNNHRDAFSGMIVVHGGYLEKIDIKLERPVAKYCLVADDIERYRSLMKTNPDKYPDLSDLTINVIYMGSIYCGFNVCDGVANSKEMDYSYESKLPTIGETDREVQIASDYLLADATESSVNVMVVVVDSKGNEISRTTDVEVKYKRGLETTIKGAFLTSEIVPWR